MGRRIVLEEGGNQSGIILEETKADNEAELQEKLKRNPGLLPVEEFGLSSPLMVVGRETPLPSGSVDLLCLANTGDLVIVEFKTGPSNPDFRHTLSQMLDYGAHLWKMGYEVFEEAVARSYFMSQRCPDDSPVYRKASLQDAAAATWPDLSEEGFQDLRTNLTRNLTDGRFFFVAVAQRFTETILRTAAYLNAVAERGRFVAVEMVRFSYGKTSAYEARTVLKPSQAEIKSTDATTRDRLLDALGDEDYRTSVKDFLEAAEGFDVRFFWGTQGMSLRIPVDERPEPLSVGWIFPQGSYGWMGALDVSLGYDRETASKYTKAIIPDLEAYVNALTALGIGKKIPTARLEAFHFSPSEFIETKDKIVAILGDLVTAIRNRYENLS